VLKGWLIAGIILAIGGSLLVWSGFQTRFAVMPSVVAPHAGTPPNSLPDNVPTAGTVTPPMLTVTDSFPVQQAQQIVQQAQQIKQVEQIPKHQTEPVKASISLPLSLSEETHWDDPRKAKLVSELAGAGWADDELATLRRLLQEPRANFRPGVMKKNFTHVETPDLYTQQLTSESVERCLDFLRVDGEQVNGVAREGGVPAEVVTAILKVETNFGKHKGDESVFNVFWSLSLGDDPGVRDEVLLKNDPEWGDKKAKMAKRAEWARTQLRDLVRMVNSGHSADPMGMVGSWAGAFGLSQFIPTSYLYYGRDGNQDGVVDLDDVADAAASIVYYLKKNGWPEDGSLRRQRLAIMSYNHSEPYVNCVLALADSLAGRRNGLQ